MSIAAKISDPVMLVALVLSPTLLWLFGVMKVKIIGVEPADANSMALSLHHGERVILNQIGGFADGVAVKEVGEETFRICRKLVDGVVLVTRDAMCASIKVTYIHFICRAALMQINI